MTRSFNWKPGMREKVAERMRKLNADPVFAEKAARRASLRMRLIHEAARKALATPSDLPSIEQPAVRSPLSSPGGRRGNT